MGEKTGPQYAAGTRGMSKDLSSRARGNSGMSHSRDIGRQAAKKAGGKAAGGNRSE
jgi:hypothetical protein